MSFGRAIRFARLPSIAFGGVPVRQYVVEAVSLPDCNDDLIAGVLNRNGHKTGRGCRWQKSRVIALRSH